MVSGRVEVSSGGLTGEGYASKLACLLTVFISSKTDGLRTPILCWLFVRGCLKVFCHLVLYRIAQNMAVCFTKLTKSESLQDRNYSLNIT